MTDSKITAKHGSIAVGGDAHGPVVNVNAGDGSPVNILIERQTARELPSFLGSVIALFAQQSLADYGRGDRRSFPPEVIDKIKYNDLPEEHRVLVDYKRHSLVLERCYHGVEQQNADARYLVRRRARVAYDKELEAACKAAAVPNSERSTFARMHAAALVDSVVTSLLSEFKSTALSASLVAQETADLAICLVVADAVVECEVLERPPNATAA